MNTFSLLLMASLVAASTLHGQSPSGSPAVPPASFEEKLREVRADLRVQDDGFSGGGALVLEKAIAGSSYVLIGEDHLTREIPRFATAVCDLMAKSGLMALADETGPQVADFVGAAAAQPDPLPRMAALLKKYPDSVEFLNAVQETELVAHAVRITHESPCQFWGLDQEFLGSAGWSLDQILATHPGPAATAALTHLQAGEQRAAAQAQESGDPGKLLLFTADDAELANIRTLLQSEGNARANALFHELVESHEIYLKNVQGSPESNTQRARLFKQHFQQRFDAASVAGRRGKVLIKCGDWHLYKGFNPLHERDLGNYVAEWAEAHDESSLHVCVLGARGKHLLYNGYNRPARTEDFVMTDDADYHWLAPAVKDQVPGAWTLYDLRRLRHREPGTVDPGMARLIDGYDLLVIIPELTPADLIH